VYEKSSSHRFEKADICDGAAMAALLDLHRPEAILHLAAESHVDRSIDGPADFISTNLVGTYTLLEAARRYWDRLDPAPRGCFRFVHVSTDEVYGSLDGGGKSDERSRYAPNSPYAATKAGSDHLVRAWGQTYGLPAIITHSSNNFGPYQFPEKLMPLMIVNALEGQNLPVYGDGRHVRDWLYVDDHARALIDIARRGAPGEAYNIGADCQRSNLETVQAICATLDRLAPQGDGRRHAERIEFVADRPGHDLRYALDPGKLMRDIGWKPKESFEAALEQTVRWYLDNRGWWQAIRERRYDGQRLGLGAG
jgi:dTDP-glucose 4,6-dehydratase